MGKRIQTRIARIPANEPTGSEMVIGCWDGKVSDHWQQEEHPLETLPPGQAGAAPEPEPAEDISG